MNVVLPGALNTSNTTFSFSSGGNTISVTVNSQTTYSGNASSFQQLRQGQNAEILGLQIGNKLTATNVRVQSDN